MPEILMREIRSRGTRPDFDAILKEVAATLDNEVKPQLIKMFSEVTSDWKHKVDFAARKRITRTYIKVYVYPTTNKAIWGFVTRGTQGGYQIPKSPPASSRDGLLHYQAYYDRRTAPPGQYGLGSGAKSGPWVSRRTVTHPGVKPRNFEETIAKKYQKPYQRVMENAMRRGAARAQREGE